MIENQRKNREKARDSEYRGLIISACFGCLPFGSVMACHACTAAANFWV